MNSVGRYASAPGGADLERCRLALRSSSGVERSCKFASPFDIPMPLLFRNLSVAPTAGAGSQPAIQKLHANRERRRSNATYVRLAAGQIPVLRASCRRCARCISSRTQRISLRFRSARQTVRVTVNR